jgi:hypothetical protein
MGQALSETADAYPQGMANKSLSASLRLAGVMGGDFVAYPQRHKPVFVVL